MQSRFIGGILLITGTSIGAGMLALPIANAAAGFYQSSLFLLLCWILMTCGAFFILEANLYLPKGKNMVSMANATLGPIGLLSAWLTYLLLLYALLSAYISGGSDVLGSLIEKTGIKFGDKYYCLIFTILFGSIVYSGIYFVDWINRGLMFAKLTIFVILTLLISPHIDFEHFQQGNIKYISGSIMILLTSFGFAIIVPNLREYFNDDIKQLKKVILIGSLIPLVCYLGWDAVIIGAMPVEGSQSLKNLMVNSHPTSTLATILGQQIQNNFLKNLFQIFTSICMLTAFLGVALCLQSFLADGLKLNHRGKEGLVLSFLTLAPPLFVVSYYPGAYLHALNHAGFLCVILLLLLPALMCYYGRKYYRASFTVPGGNVVPVLIMILSLLLILLELYNKVY